MSAKQPREILVREEWARALLQAPSTSGPGTIYERMRAAQDEWRSALLEARNALAQNPLTPTVAEAVAREHGRKGVGTALSLNDEGQMLLEVGIRGWKSTLPSLESLRQEAEGLGIDTQPLGRSKRSLVEAITAKRSTRPKMMRTAPAVGPVVTIPDPQDPKISIH